MRVSKLKCTITLTPDESRAAEHNADVRQRVQARARDLADWAGLDCIVYALRNGVRVPMHVALYPA